MTTACFKANSIRVDCWGIPGAAEGAALMHVDGGWETAVDLSTSVTMMSMKRHEINTHGHVTKFVFWDAKSVDADTHKFRWQVRYFGYRQDGNDDVREYGTGTADSLDDAVIAAGKVFDHAVRTERHYRAKAHRAAAENA